jgi:hypothetical protein
MSRPRFAFILALVATVALVALPARRAAAQPAPPPTLTLPGWLNGLTLGGGALLWYDQPLVVDPGKNSVSLYFAHLIIDGRWGRWGLHLETRFRDSRLRPFFDSSSWVQEAYASVSVGSTTLKAGKIYSHLGYFWDGSFYGNVQVYDGLKLDPDYGVSIEGTPWADRRFGLQWWAQYFVLDGGTNVSLVGRDTISIPGAHRRNQLIGRVEPFFKPSPRSELRLGLSGELLQADLSAVAGNGVHNVGRFAADFKVAVGPWLLWGEYLRQDGQTVTDFPIPPPAPAITTAAGAASDAAAAALGRSSSHNNYYWVGTQLSWRRLTARYAFSVGDYHDVDVLEWFHLPSLSVLISPNLSILGELVWWERSTPTTGHTFVARSVDITLYAHF